MSTLSEFIHWIEKHVDIHKEYTISQIAQIIGKAMVNFFEESNTGY